MEQMFKKFSPPTDTQASKATSQAHPSQVVDAPQQPIPPVQSPPPEPMDTSISQAASTIKKGLKGIKGSSTIASSTIKAVVSPTPPPLIQPQTQSESPLQRLEKGDYGVTGDSSYSSSSQVDDSEPKNLAPPPKAGFHAFIDRVRQYLGIDDPAKQRTTNWDQDSAGIPTCSVWNSPHVRLRSNSLLWTTLQNFCKTRTQ